MNHKNGSPCNLDHLTLIVYNPLPKHQHKQKYFLSDKKCSTKFAVILVNFVNLWKHIFKKIIKKKYKQPENWLPCTEEPHKMLSELVQFSAHSHILHLTIILPFISVPFKRSSEFATYVARLVLLDLIALNNGDTWNSEIHYVIFCTSQYYFLSWVQTLSVLPSGQNSRLHTRA
jgi:hypothetical protein